MRSKKVKAIFKGRNGSCGYKTNKEYTLIIHHQVDMYIQIEDVKGGGHNSYGSMVSLLENWDNVRVVS